MPRSITVSKRTVESASTDCWESVTVHVKLPLGTSSVYTNFIVYLPMHGVHRADLCGILVHCNVCRLNRRYSEDSRNFFFLLSAFDSVHFARSTYLDAHSTYENGCDFSLPVNESLLPSSAI